MLNIAKIIHLLPLQYTLTLAREKTALNKYFDFPKILTPKEPSTKYVRNATFSEKLTFLTP